MRISELKTRILYLEIFSMNPIFMKILWKWWKPIDWLDITVTNKVFKYPSIIQAKVEKKRAAIFISETEKGKKIRDSDLYRVDDIDISGDGCKIGLWIMRWSEHYVMRYLSKSKALLTEKSLSNGIACSALIETNDGYFVFWERGNNNAGSKGWQIALVGWTLHPDEGKVDSYLWFYDHVLRELQEETGIASQYIYDSKFVGIQRMYNGGIGFVYYLRLWIWKDAVQYLFEQENDGEFQSLKFVPRDEVKGFLENICFKNGVLKRTMGLQIDYLEEIFRNNRDEKSQKNERKENRPNVVEFLLYLFGWR